MIKRNWNYVTFALSLLLIFSITGCSSQTAKAQGNTGSSIQASSQAVSSSGTEKSRILVSWEVMPNDLLTVGESTMLNMVVSNKSNIAINGISVKVKLSDDASFEVADAFTAFDQKNGCMFFYDNQKFDPDSNMALSISIKPKKSGKFNIPFYFYDIEGNKPIKINNGVSSITATFSVA